MAPEATRRTLSRWGWRWPRTPEELPNLKGIPVFISAGRFDQVVPLGEVERLSRLFVEAGAEVTLNWENGTHALAGQEVKKAANWSLENFGSWAPGAKL